MGKAIKIAAGIGIVLLIVIFAPDFLSTTLEPKDIQGLVKTVLDDGVITVSVEQIPDIPNPTIPKKAITLAFNAWEQNNPDLNFKFVEDANAEIVITWTTVENPTHTGLASCGFKCILEISLGGYDCNNRYIQADRDRVTDTIMHELGHALGLGHNNNENHLMFAEDGLSDANFDTLGLNIPVSFGGYYIGQSTLITEFDSLNNQYEIKHSELEAILDDFGITAEEYDDNPDVRSNALAIKANPVIREINSIVLKVDDLGEKLDCYPNFEFTKLNS